MKLPHPGARAGGFSLVEVMVGLVVISVGLLGIAKMQALAISSTGSAKMRSLAALEAAGLASAMHADRAYWSNVAATKAVPFVVTTSNSSIATATDAALKVTQSCTTPAANAAQTVCPTAQMAAYDLQDWLAGTPSVTAGLSSQLPNPQSTITCYPFTASSPISCIINISWNENLVSMNTASANVAAVEATSYTLYVQP
jgi:type IV pilus assembly protein PilV